MTRTMLHHENTTAATTTEAEEDLPTLYDAIQKCMPIDVVQRIITNHPEQLTWRDSIYEYLPLHTALCDDSYDDTELLFNTVRLLVESYPECVQEKEFNGMLPLHLAAYYEYNSSIATIQFLFEQYPEGAREKDEGGNLPVHCHLNSDSGHFSMEKLRFLVKQYPECAQEKNNGGQLLLHLAVKGMRVNEDEDEDEGKNENEYTMQVPQFLIDQFPGGLQVKDNDGYLPLHRAAANRYASLDLIKDMVARFPLSVCNITPDHGYLPLHLAMNAARAIEVPRFLIEQFTGGLRVTDNEGYLPLHRAVDKGGHQLVDLIQYMVKKFPQGLKEKTLEHGYLPLHLAVNVCCSSEIPKFLVEQFPSSVRVKDKNGYLPLHRAVTRYCTLDLVHFLVEKFPQGVQELTLDSGSLPIHLAVSVGSSIDIVRFLVKQFRLCVRVKDNDGYLPLHRAVTYSDVSLDLIKYLVDQYPQGLREISLGHGFLPLHLAVGVAYSTKIPLFLMKQYPESIRVKDNDGYLPLHRAVTNSGPKSLALVRFLAERFPQGIREKTHDRAFLPLHLALSVKNLLSIEVPRYLIDQYPQGLKETTNDGWLPVLLAATTATSPSHRLHLELVYVCVLQFPNILF